MRHNNKNDRVVIILEIIFIILLITDIFFFSRYTLTHYLTNLNDWRTATYYFLSTLTQSEAALFAIVFTLSIFLLQYSGVGARFLGLLVTGIPLLMLTLFSFVLTLILGLISFSLVNKPFFPWLLSLILVIAFISIGSLATFILQSSEIINRIPEIIAKKIQKSGLNDNLTFISSEYLKRNTWNFQDDLGFFLSFSEIKNAIKKYLMNHLENENHYIFSIKFYSHILKNACLVGNCRIMGWIFSELIEIFNAKYLKYAGNAEAEKNILQENLWSNLEKMVKENLFKGKCFSEFFLFFGNLLGNIERNKNFDVRLKEFLICKISDFLRYFIESPPHLKENVSDILDLSRKIFSVLDKELLEEDKYECVITNLISPFLDWVFKIFPTSEDMGKISLIPQIYNENKEELYFVDEFGKLLLEYIKIWKGKQNTEKYSLYLGIIEKNYKGDFSKVKTLFLKEYYYKGQKRRLNHLKDLAENFHKKV